MMKKSLILRIACLLQLSLFCPLLAFAHSEKLPGSQFVGVWEPVGNFRKLNNDPVFTPETAKDIERQTKLREQGDYVNSRQFPSMIKAPTVYEELEGNIHLIDLRKEDFYKKGHIKGAINVRMPDILDHFENEILPFQIPCAPDIILSAMNKGRKNKKK